MSNRLPIKDLISTFKSTSLSIKLYAVCVVYVYRFHNQRPNTFAATTVVAAPTALPALATAAVPAAPSPAAPTD